MQELEKILEEIEEICVDDTDFGVDCNLQGRSNLPCDNCYECIKDVCKDIIRKHMNDGWIPVDQPPEIDCRTILIQLKNEGIMEGLYNGSEFVGIDRMGVYQFLENNPPVYWRRKPEPYRPERSEEE